MDLHNNLDIRRAISPTRSTDDTPLVSQIIDRAGTEGLEFAIAIGTIDDANATFAVLVEDDDDPAMGTAAAVDDSQLLGTEAGAAFTYDDDDKVTKIGYIGVKRYVRLKITPSGNSANSDGADISALAILGGGGKARPFSTQKQ